MDTAIPTAIPQLYRTTGHQIKTEPRAWLESQALKILMKNNEVNKSNSNKKIAIILGVIAFIWYLASMFTLWK